MCIDSAKSKPFFDCGICGPYSPILPIEFKCQIAFNWNVHRFGKDKAILPTMEIEVRIALYYQWNLNANWHLIGMCIDSAKSKPF